MVLQTLRGCGHLCPCWPLPFSSAVIDASISGTTPSCSLHPWGQSKHESTEACRNECVRAHTLDNSNHITLPACLVEHPLPHMRSTVQSTHWGVLTLAIRVRHLPDLQRAECLWHPFEATVLRLQGGAESPGLVWGKTELSHYL